MDDEIIGYADADWDGNKDDRKSTTGYVFLINGGPVSWTSYKQSSNAVSTMEAEYMALSDASREAIARTHLCTDLNIETSTPLLLSDSQNTLNLTSPTLNYQCQKHIDIRYHFIHDVIQKDQVIVDFIPSEEQPADILTKALGTQSHQNCVERLRLRPI